MNKKEFLDKLKRETLNERLVAQYDEFIDDRVADGESEEAVVASYNLKQIVRMHELEQRAAKGQNTASDNVPANSRPINMKNPILCLVLTLVGFAAAITFFALIGYFIAELVETVGGYYDHMGEAYVRGEIIGYSILLGFSVLGLIGGLVAGFIFLKKYRKARR